LNGPSFPLTVVLSFQLSFAIVPLVMFTASRAKMGEVVAPLWLTGLCWLIAAVIIVLNVNLLSTVLLGRLQPLPSE
jgi:manganese transport protein